jgi:hypothetical protein
MLRKTVMKFFSSVANKSSIKAEKERAQQYDFALTV